jgi:TRAP-type C4-dicarboxylate transport system permease small subunit
MENPIHDTPRRTGWTGAADRIITAWAILGGVVVLGVVLVNVMTVVGGIIGHPFPGDFELTQMGIAVAAFAFLPYCQLTGANVTADIFTSGAGPRLVSIFTLVAAVVALLFALLLIRQVYLGMLSQREYNYATAILNLPTWWAYMAAIPSLVLLILASFITLIESFHGATRGDIA